MSCNLLEDLKQIESDLDARQDIKEALLAHISRFVADNSETQEFPASFWGIRIKPAPPEFHVNFPSAFEYSLTLNDEYMDDNGEIIVIDDGINAFSIETGQNVVEQLGFSVPPGNLNCFPIWDFSPGVNKLTNGCQDNIAFTGTIQIKNIYTRSEPTVDPIVLEYQNSPNDSRWVNFTYEGGGVYDDATNTFIINPNDSNDVPIYSPFNPDDFIITTTTINVFPGGSGGIFEPGNSSNKLIDKHTGSVRFSLFAQNLEFNKIYPIPLTISIHNGNGSAHKNITLNVTTGWNPTSQPGTLRGRWLTDYPSLEMLPK